MKGRLFGLGAVFAGATLAIGMPSAGAAAASKTVEASFGIESWYQTGSRCPDTPICAPTPIALNPYGPGTLHVAVSAGNETARSYLTLRGRTSPPGKSLQAAVLVIPLDTTTPGNGSLEPATAHLEVCLAKGPLRPADGELGPPPQVDCTSHAPLAYTDAPNPELSADLLPLLPALRTLAAGDVSLALIPMTGVQSDTWHVVYSSHAREAPPTRPASIGLTYGVGESPEPSPTPWVTTTTLGPAPGVEGPVVGSPDLTMPPGPALAPTVAHPTDVTPVASASTETVIERFRYPGVLLLPLALACLAFLAVSSVTSDMSRPAVRSDP